MSHTMNLTKMIAQKELNMHKAIEEHNKAIALLKQELLAQGLTNGEMQLIEIAINKYIHNPETRSVETAIRHEFRNAGHRAIPEVFAIET